jgi:hypothetical protein
MAEIPPPPQEGPVTFRDVLTTVLRFGDNQADTLITEGYDSLHELRFWGYEDIATWAANKGKITLLRGGCSYGDPRVKGLQALAFYATDMHRRGLPLSLINFNDEMLLKYKEMVRVDRARKGTKSDVSMPDPLVHDTIWEDWENSLINYLQAKMGIDNIPLSYVIRSDDRPVAVPEQSEDLTRYLDLVYNAPFEGPAFAEDSATVFSILEALTLGQDSANWINRRTRQTRNGRQAMLDLKHHFDGGEEKYKRKQVALARLELLNYKHEKIMSFQVFSTKLKKCFDTIEVCDQAYSETTKIDILLRKMKSNSHELRNVSTLIRQDPEKYDTFMKVTQEYAKFVAFMFPEEGISDRGGRHRKKRSVHGANRNQNGDKRKFSYKTTNKNGKTYCNGIDISDQTRTFTADEWQKLPYSFKKELYNNKERRAKKNKRDTAGAETDRTDTTDESISTNTTISRIINGIMRAQLAHGDSVAERPAARQPRMGAGGSTARQAAGTETSSLAGSEITQDTRWDHNGNRL